ncbi:MULTISPECIES: hypothetical protein [unclassified Streptomyces]|uniref:hypothetical protein n=1 Tax=unclassified Streptomyces TaxID=2593676 RepID=UPI00380438E6
MTACTIADIRQVAAETTLAVPGVVALQPTLASRLAQAASRQVPGVRGDGLASPRSGIRVTSGEEGSGWIVEVRCVMTEGLRALDVARTVHDRTTASLLTLLATHGLPAKALTVIVTITRMSHPPL